MVGSQYWFSLGIHIIYRLFAPYTYISDIHSLKRFLANSNRTYLFLITSMASSTPSEDYDYPIDYYQECQLANKQFSRWRRLGGRARWSARHIHKSREAWHKRKLPRPGQPLFFGGKKDREPWKFFRFPSPRKSSEPDFNFPYSFDDPKQERVRQRVVSAVNYFDRAAHKFKYKKTLGHGGCKLARRYSVRGCC